MTEDFSIPPDHWVNRLEAIGACSKSLKFCLKFSSPQEAWDECDRPWWMTWLLNERNAWHKEGEGKACRERLMATFLPPVQQAIELEESIDDEDRERLLAAARSLAGILNASSSDVNRLVTVIYSTRWEGRGADFWISLSELVDLARPGYGCDISMIYRALSADEVCDLLRSIYPYPPPLPNCD